MSDTVSAFLSVMAAGMAFQAVTGPQLIHDGRLAEALDGYRRAAEASPKSVAANNGAGVVLDLLGDYAEAQRYFNQAIKAALTPLEGAQAQRALAVSFGFDRDCRSAEKADRLAYEYYHSAPDFYSAGEVADELGRICLDAGDFDTAYDWYRKGHDTGLLETNIPQVRKDLWDFRWAHAKARVAARRGKLDDARKYVAAARSILNKGNNPDQQVYFAYLTGYVAFYSGDYAAALADLRNAVQTDPYIQCLIAQSYDKLGDHVKALEYYKSAANTTAHSVPAAYARPFASAKLK
jgi:tetratricopeptide (TPR) repeat protein